MGLEPDDDPDHERDHAPDHDPEPDREPAAGAAVPSAEPAVPGLWSSLLIYTALRILLIAVLAVLLSFLVIPLVAFAFAVVLQLPVAWFLFAPQRRRVNAALAAASSSRRADRERLRNALSGDG